MPHSDDPNFPRRPKSGVRSQPQLPVPPSKIPTDPDHPVFHQGPVEDTGEHSQPQFDDPEPVPAEERRAPLPASPRNTGRRTMDHVQQKGMWALVIGVLMQSGFMTMAWRLMSTNAEQVKDERESSQKQADAYRLQLAVQHRELVEAMKDLASSNKEIARAAQDGLEELHKGQEEVEKEKRKLEVEKARLHRVGKQP